MEEIVGFSRAVRVGSFIAVGGTAPVDVNGKTLGIGDVYAQPKQCFEIIKAALEHVGSGLQDIELTRVILTDINNWKDAIEARKLYCRDARRDLAASARAPGMHCYEWIEASTQSMPLDDGEFDLAFCHHGLQLFPDKTATLSEIRRALKPGALLVVTCWKAITPLFAPNQLDHAHAAKGKADEKHHHRVGRRERSRFATECPLL
ncbi:Rid family hydrolase [Ruegeria sp. HKCCSP346]|uniref:Rid family hydrolase n=2 Tax=unclassified Ruegeria TaxID=2625375 RepID=UPI001AE608F6